LIAIPNCEISVASDIDQDMSVEFVMPDFVLKQRLA